MSKILYLECGSGISGDMSVAALLDLGANQKKLEQALDSMSLNGYHCSISKVNSYGLEATDFDVDVHEEHGHHHRHLADVYKVIDCAKIDEKANLLAKKIFLIVAEAEAKAHGVAINEVHFHEVGAIDSIVDIVAFAVCFTDLSVDGCVVSTLSEGTGFVNCQHGRLPVPVPAVAAICANHGLAMQITQSVGEMITPTGAAIAAAIKSLDKLPNTFVIKKIGLGAGKRDFGHANILRAMLIGDKDVEDNDSITLLESNIDDSTGEELGLVMEQLFEAGARDVHFIPVYMKKNRPAVLLRVIVDTSLVGQMEEIIFIGTTSIGIRKSIINRTTLKRSSIEYKLSAGTILVKKCEFGKKTLYYPEYESVKELSKKTKIDFLTLWNGAKNELKGL